MAISPSPDVARKSLRPSGFLFAAAAALALSGAAHAKLYVFGDSLSDNGNIHKVTFGAEPGNGYFSGRFSNGPVWSELLGARLGKAPGLLYYDPLLTSRVDGFNFAHGGAAAVERWFLPDFLEAPGQVSYYARQVRKGRMTGRGADIATLWIGGNDYLLYNEGSAATGVAGVMKSLTQLDATGVGRIVLLNLPSLGEIPGEITGPDRAKLNTVSLRHNALLNSAVAAYRPQARALITQVDVAALFNAVRRGAGGFTVTKPGDRGSRTGTCKGDGLILASCPANYFFYDGVHPTASGHRFIAGVVRDRLAAPIAATARVALGEASALSTMTAQLGQIKTRLGAIRDGEGPSGYSFGTGDALLQNNWSQGYGADWRDGNVSFGMNMIEAEQNAALAETAAMSAKGDAWGFAMYAAWQDDGLSAALAVTALKNVLDYDRQTEIEGLERAAGIGEVAASAVQASLAHEFVSGAFSVRPEASLTVTRMDFASFTETGTMGLSDNVYESQSLIGALGEIGATFQYTSETWGLSLRAFGVARLDGDASVWTAAPAAMMGGQSFALDRDSSGHGGGVWAQTWLAGQDGWALSAEGGVFSDMQRSEGAARLSLKVEF